MNIELKDKIKVDKSFINDLITKSWQDSESIQSQISSIEVDSAEAANIVKLLKNLLTNYYVFAGCLENILTDIDTAKVADFEPNLEAAPKPIQATTPIVAKAEETTPMKIGILPEFGSELDSEEKLPEVDEPFEYFVDFDEPVGDPLTDDDLYN
jgi:hypothetical protein